MSGFKDVVGHSEIIQYIQNAVTEDKVSHAYILNGEKGSGKKMLAGLFAQTLQCEKGGTEPCYECHSCKQAVSGNHPDIIWVTHEKPNSISVDDIRVQINGDIQVKPYNGKYKIYIVPDADMMTVQAQNALLKTIEEPPAYAVILLLTENANSLLPTICSRCVMLKLRNIKDQLVKRYLMESSLSFLGLGVQIPRASWGSMLQGAQAHILDYPLLAVYPGVMILITVLSFNLLGDILRNALEPKIVE